VSQLHTFPYMMAPKGFLKFHGLTAFWWRKLPQCTNFFCSHWYKLHNFWLNNFICVHFLSPETGAAFIPRRWLAAKGWSHAH